MSNKEWVSPDLEHYPEIIAPVLCKGRPGEMAYTELDKMADTIAAKHQECGYN